ncbi:alkane 1-monooxygenase [Serinibacter arcticus]|uniref:Alkane 1-monooxygenase n=1 Tax=Serinibacter arcticus TaxID=1655435 RepID=A0A2U1ZSB7_9MICO|nr:LLM class flavin-dependent oxidoreductase [Serinibacter arcticus]PWD49878.1 alkane 1-monooxygenase [Serinibacter arcticus]
MTLKLSVLDLAPVAPHQSIGESLAASVTLAQQAEASGYSRVWYAEHHNMPNIASSATAVLIAHIAAHTRHIRVGAGGVMLPNHSPLVVAEQFGTLEALHPGRIDLGLGRAAGSDALTSAALRRRPSAADDFPQDVRELQGLLSDTPPVPGVQAIPGSGTHVPLYILGTSLFGAVLAARLGLPYAFASHFAPSLLHEAAETYRTHFEPSPQTPRPYLIAGVNVIAADTREEAFAIRLKIRRDAAAALARPGQDVDEDTADALLRGPADAHFDQLMHYTAVGDTTDVATYLRDFAASIRADELITAHQAPTLDQRLRSLALAAQGTGVTPSTT